MRLVVHMGATKTASTFLQQCLALNEDVLLDAGIYLPQSGRRKAGRVNHHNLAWQLLGDSRYRQANGDWEALAKEVADCETDLVMLSTEAFARAATDERVRVSLSRRMFEIADDVTLVYVVRDPLARINSMYSQTVKTFASPGPFDTYAARSVQSGFYDLQRAFEFWYSGSRARFVAIRFDEWIKSGPLPTLLRVLDVAEPPELEIPQDLANPSPGPMAVAAIGLLCAHLRAMDPGFSRRSAATTKLSQVAQRRSDKMGWNEGKFWGWSGDRAVWAANRLAPTNERFSRAVWGEPWPLPTPLTTPPSVVSLLEVTKSQRREVDKFVASMTKRYLTLLSARSASDEVDSEAIEIEDFAIDTDESEEAVAPRGRRGRGRNRNRR